MTTKQFPASRRQFITGAAAGAVATSAMLMSGVSRAQLAPGIKRAALNTPIVHMMSPDASKGLTATAKSATKADLVALRSAVKGKGQFPTKFSMTDVDSIEKAFDTHEFTSHALLGFKTAGIPIGMSSAAADNISACCCCCPCCSTAAAVTRSV